MSEVMKFSLNILDLIFEVFKNFGKNIKMRQIILIDVIILYM